jgi:hypothetical protein
MTSLSHRIARLFCVVTALMFAGGTPTIQAQEFALHSFDRQQLTDVYYSEGIAAGDLNRDGHVDLIYGPLWFAGPSFKEHHEIFQAKPQPKERYANHFFAWVYDFNGDGWNDVLTAGFPGTPGYVYENPKSERHGKEWPKHQVLDAVSNESPQFVNIVGDERPELVCTNNGFFGYATFDPAKPLEAWKFTAISDKIAPVPFGHGLGIGDVNGDGKEDIIMKDGWFEQPKSANSPARWELHRVKFCTTGGAEMYAYDVDGDGDNDIITSLAAHDFGIAWHEQVRDGDKITFKQHIIVGDDAANNRYGVLFSEPHSVNFADIDGDGLKDIVTGKTYWSHHTKSPLWDAGAVVYWFKLVRGKDGIDWVPNKADGDSGIGRQVIVHDIDRDGLPDLAAGGMKGANVLLHKKIAVTEQAWKDAQPVVKFNTVKPYVYSPPAPVAAVATVSVTHVAGALEGEKLKVVRASSGSAGVQKMSNFKGGKWSGDEQLFWRGAKPGDKLELEFNVPKDGMFDLSGVLTKAKDYATVQLQLDDQPLGEPLDLFSAEVVTTGELKLGKHQLAAGNHKLTILIQGSNPAATKSYMVGVDYLRLSGN